MKHDPAMPPVEGCEAFQWQLSEIADSDAAPTPELQAHLRSCAECARFAAQWLQGPPAELARPVSAEPDTELLERILDSMAPPNVVRFPAARAPHPSWPLWLGRLAACLALAGFSYWLLNPSPSPVGQPPAAAASAPTLAQGLAQMEDRTKREQAVLQTALVDGGRKVRGNIAWSVSALE